MSKTFSQPVAMKVTNRKEAEEIMNELSKMGYDNSDINNFDENMDDGYHFLTTRYYDSYENSFGFDTRPEERHYHIKTFNKGLFLAIAAMTHGSDWHVGEYLNYNGNVFRVNIINRNGSNSYKTGSVTQDCLSYRKATLEEILIYFENTSKTVEKDCRFPFYLGLDDARSIVRVACSTWKKKLTELWGKDILLNNSAIIKEDFYKEMRRACTPEQNSVFDSIFGKDKPEFKEINVTVKVSSQEELDNLEAKYNVI